MADVFISYCREDEAYLKRLLQTLAGYSMGVCETCWSDRRVAAGQLWQEELNTALASAKLAILMVTPGFLASDFIKQHELPQLLARAEAGSLTLVPIPVRPVDWQAQRFSRYQSLLDPKQPLAKRAGAEQDDAYVEIGQFIVAQLAQVRETRAGLGTPRQAHDPQAEELARLQRERNRLVVEGKPVEELTQRIMALRRSMRQGRQLRQGDVLCDRYILEQQLGSGGFASVWRAMDHGQNRLVALKLLHGQYSEDKTRRERFFRGARKMAELKHEGIVTVHERQCRDGQVFFYVMEYMPGGDLEAAVLRGDVPRELWLPVLLQVGEALQYAHEHKLVHRDIKPSNILLSRDGRQARLSDFDPVRDAQSTAGTRDGLGTFVYAAPECLHDGANGDARADVFGLGMTFVFAMAGKKLEIEALVDAPGTIGALGLQAPLAKALTRAVALKRDQRTTSVAALCHEIQTALAPPPEPPSLAKSQEMAAMLKPQPVAVAEQKDVKEKPGTASPVNNQRLGAEVAYASPRAKKTTNARWAWLGLLVAVAILGVSLLNLFDPLQTPPEGVTKAEPEVERDNPAEPVKREASSEAKNRETMAQKSADNRNASKILDSKHAKGEDAKDSGSVNVKVERQSSIPTTKRADPEPSKYPWAERSGVDAIGTWAEIEVKGVRAVLRWIPAGSFWMGSPADELDRYDDETRHRVTLTRGFWLGETEVTQALWQAVMGGNPSGFKGPNLPVEGVSWDDTAVFLEKLNRLVPGLEMRLPTEAEWEYACRAGTQTPFCFGLTIDSRQVNFNGNYPYGNGPKSEFRGVTVAVKSLPANAWGLHEMHGNVWEWCADVMGPYSAQEAVDPRGPATGAKRVLRGGSWGYFGGYVRAAYRAAAWPGNRNGYLGFRLARGQETAF